MQPNDIWKAIDRIDELNKCNKEDIKSWLDADHEYDQMKKENVTKVLHLLREKFPKMEWELYRKTDGILEGLILSIVTCEEPDVEITFEWNMHFDKLSIRFDPNNSPVEYWKFDVSCTSYAGLHYDLFLPIIDAYISKRERDGKEMKEICGE